MRIDAGTGFAAFDVYDEAMSRMIPDACRRLHYCPAHRGEFGGRAP